MGERAEGRRGSARRLRGEGSCLPGREGLVQVAALSEEEQLPVPGLQPLLFLLPGLEHLLLFVPQDLQPFLDLGMSMWRACTRESRMEKTEAGPKGSV